MPNQSGDAEGIDFPKAPSGSQWSRTTVEKLRHLSCGVVTGCKINSILDHLDHLTRQLALTGAALRSLVKGNKELSECIEYLMSCPGIGFRISCYVLARVGDWRQLRMSKEMGAFFGLVPTERSTGDRTDRGSITKCGDPRLRSMLIQGAWVAIRKDKELREFYERVCSSHSKKVAARVAIVAVARKLAQRMHCVLKEQRNYEHRTAA